MRIFVALALICIAIGILYSQCEMRVLEQCYANTDGVAYCE